MMMEEKKCKQPADRNSKQTAEKTSLANILSKTPTKKIVPPTKPTFATKNNATNKTPIKLIKTRTESLKGLLHTNETNPPEPLKVKIVKPKNKSGSPLKVQKAGAIIKQKTPVKKNSVPASSPFKIPIKE